MMSGYDFLKSQVLRRWQNADGGWLRLPWVCCAKRRGWRDTWAWRRLTAGRSGEGGTRWAWWRCASGSTSRPPCDWTWSDARRWTAEWAGSTTDPTRWPTWERRTQPGRWRRRWALAACTGSPSSWAESVVRCRLLTTSPDSAVDACPRLKTSHGYRWYPTSSEATRAHHFYFLTSLFFIFIVSLLFFYLCNSCTNFILNN